MPSRISITHSTYENVMDILVDGKHSIDIYSPIRQFMDRPFHEWCSKIFQYIGEEIGPGYELEFCGSPEETPVISILASSEKDCKKFTPKLTQISTPLPQRMSSLCKIIKRYSIDFGNPIVYDVNFISTISTDTFSRQISQLDVQNSFCKLSFTERKHQDKIHCSGIDFYLVSNMDEALSMADSYAIGNPIYILINSEKHGFITKKNNAFIYYVSNNTFFNIIFECLLLIPLKEIFLLSAERLLAMSTNTEIKNQIRGILASNPICNISVAREVELGRSVDIYCETSPPDASKPELVFTYQVPGIVECTQGRVFGRKEGATKVYVSRKGSSGILAELDFIVKRKNKIREVMLSETSLTMGEGESFKIDVDFIPEDADNVDSLIWNAWPGETIEVTDGLVIARKQGEGRVICSAETASAQCHILVLPWLVEMSLPKKILENGLCLYAGEEFILDIQTTPENAIDSEIIVSSDNLLVANVIGKKIIGVDSGTATVTVENSSGKFRQSFKVLVKI